MLIRTPALERNVNESESRKESRAEITVQQRDVILTLKKKKSSQSQDVQQSPSDLIKASAERVLRT